MTVPYRLKAGDVGPHQQSQVSCGAACLTVSRMMVDPVFAVWILEGIGPDSGATADARPSSERFADSERTVMARTNAALSPDRPLQVPWPRSFGTPPWGALVELEHGAALPGTRYELGTVRVASQTALDAAFAVLVSRVREGRPAILYVGNALLPRHVTMVLAGDADGLDVYEPAGGRVQRVSRSAFTERRVDLGGWNVPWFVIQPLAQVLAADAAPGWGAVSADAVG